MNVNHNRDAKQPCDQNVEEFSVKATVGGRMDAHNSRPLEENRGDEQTPSPDREHDPAPFPVPISIRREMLTVALGPKAGSSIVGNHRRYSALRADIWSDDHHPDGWRTPHHDDKPAQASLLELFPWIIELFLPPLHIRSAMFAPSQPYNDSQHYEEFLPGLYLH